MKYILFLLLVSGSGPAPVAAITTAEFESEAACSSAADQAQKLYNVNRVQVQIPMSTWCIPKGSPAPGP
jgi:hypothetical protein